MGESGRGSKRGRFKKVISSWLGGVLEGIVVGLVLGITTAFSFNSWQVECNAREVLWKEFSKVTTEYVEFGRKARVDIVERHYDHKNKSESMKKWEGWLWIDFQRVLADVTKNCPTKVASAVKDLRCANRKYYIYYDALDEHDSLSVAFEKERLKFKKDCGSEEWSALTNFGHERDAEILDREAKKQFEDLQEAQKSAADAIWDWSKISFLQYLWYRVQSFFVAQPPRKAAGGEREDERRGYAQEIIRWTLG